MGQPSKSRFLRLFPLQSVVLFPAMELPLVVFEPRYLQLTQECTEADEPFGVLLLKEGREVGDPDLHPYETGTTAHIREVTPTGDGRLQVIATGGTRFRVQQFDRSHPYLAAEVELLEDDADDRVDQSIARQVKEEATSFVRKLMALRGGFVREVPLPDAPTPLSYHVAQLLQGSPAVQQQLLEEPTPERLAHELRIIQSAMERLSQREHGEGPRRRFSPN